jgi:hypothetical protein
MATSPASMSAAAAQYQESLSKYEQRRSSSTIPPEAQPALNGTAPTPESAAVNIKQESHDQVKPPSQSILRCPRKSLTARQPPPALPSQSSTPAPVPVVDRAASTPTGQVNGEVKAGETASAIPLHPVEHGAPFRKYITSKVTPSLLEGMKELGLKQ